MLLRAKWLQLSTAAVVAAAVALYAGASYHLAYQVTLADRIPLKAAPSDFGLPFEEVEFPSRGGEVLLRGWYIPAVGARANLIIAHGVDSNRAATDLGTLEIARDLRQRGFNLLLFDLRGHGESDGIRVSAGYFERLDVLGAFDLLVNRGVPSETIGLQGFSMGGAVVIQAAGEEPRVRAVVSDSGFADVSDLIVEETGRRTPSPAWLAPVVLPGMQVAARLAYGIDLAAIRPEAVVGRLHYPVLLIHGTADTRIPAAHSERMKRASPHPDTDLWLVDGAEHVRAYRTTPQAYIDRVASYFEGRVK